MNMYINHQNKMIQSNEPDFTVLHKNSMLDCCQLQGYVCFFFLFSVAAENVIKLVTSYYLKLAPSQHW